MANPNLLARSQASLSALKFTNPQQWVADAAAVGSTSAMQCECEWGDGKVKKAKDT